MGGTAGQQSPDPGVARLAGQSNTPWLTAFGQQAPYFPPKPPQAAQPATWPAQMPPAYDPNQAQIGMAPNRQLPMNPYAMDQPTIGIAPPPGAQQPPPGMAVPPDIMSQRPTLDQWTANLLTPPQLAYSGFAGYGKPYG